MAVGVILGGAFTAIVTAINKNIISPLIAWAIGDTNLSESVITVLKYKPAAEADVEAGLAATVGEQIPDIIISWGSLIQAVIDFLMIAIILFIIIKVVTNLVNKAKEAKQNMELATIEEQEQLNEIYNQINDEWTFDEFNENLRDSWYELLKHQRYPYPMINQMAGGDGLGRIAHRPGGMRGHRRR